MRIIHVIDDLSIGGGQKLVHDLAIQQRKDGYDVSILSIVRVINHITDNLSQNGVGMDCLFDNKKNMYNPLAVIKMKKYLKNADIVHVHLFPANYFCVFCKKLFNLKFKLILTEHSTNNRRRNKIILKPLEKYIYRNIDKIVGCAPKVAERLNAFLGCDVAEFIPNGVNVSEINQTAPYNKADLLGKEHENSKMLLMVARFREPKDQNTLIRSLELLDDDVVAVFAGDGENLEKSRRYAEDLGLAKICFFLGVRQDIPRLVNTADINILSSKWEGLSLSSVEAMSTGKPFIGSNVNGIKEVVENAGLLFECGNARDLADKINLLLNEEFGAMTGVKCYERALEYDISSCTESYTSIYDEVLYN